MEDGRPLVVKYNGRDQSPEESRDSRETDRIGQLCANASGGRVAFVAATPANFLQQSPPPWQARDVSAGTSFCSMERNGTAFPGISFR